MARNDQASLANLPLVSTYGVTCCSVIRAECRVGREEMPEHCNALSYAGSSFLSLAFSSSRAKNLLAFSWTSACSE